MTRAGIRQWRQRGWGSGGGTYTWPNRPGPLDQGFGPKNVAQAQCGTTFSCLCLAWPATVPVPGPPYRPVVPSRARHGPPYILNYVCGRAFWKFKGWSGIAGASLDRHISMDLWRTLTGILKIWKPRWHHLPSLKAAGAFYSRGWETCQVPPLQQKRWHAWAQLKFIEQLLYQFGKKKIVWLNKQL